jgi:hypothetical protein
MLKTVPGLVQQLGPGKRNFRNNIQTTPWQGGGVAGGGQARAGNGNWFKSMFPVTNATRGSVILAQNEIIGEGGGGPNRLKKARRRGGQKPGGGPNSSVPGLPGSSVPGGLTPNAPVLAPGQKDYNPVTGQTQGTANAGNPIFMGGVEDGTRASGTPMYTDANQTYLDQALAQSYENDAAQQQSQQALQDDVVGDTIQDNIQPLPAINSLPAQNIFDDPTKTELKPGSVQDIFDDPRYAVKEEEDEFFDAPEPGT